MPRRRRRGLTLLELIVAATIMTTIVTAVAAVLRGTHTMWRAQQDDAERLEAASATLRHIVRQVRQCGAVTAISDARETSGSLAVTMTDGTEYVWGHVAASDDVTFGTERTVEKNPLLAEHIGALHFVGYEADGATVTTVANDIQAVECLVRVDLPRTTGGTVWLSSWVCLRTW